jgi:hypothetical protein
VTLSTSTLALQLAQGFGAMHLLLIIGLLPVLAGRGVPRSLREYSTNGISRALLGITSVGMATIGVPLVRGAAAETREAK